MGQRLGSGPFAETLDPDARKTIALAATAAIAVLALGVGLASAHTTSFNSTVTIDWNGQFFGTVSPPRAGCVPNRLVKLFQKDAGPDTFLGSDRTDQQGDWQVNTPAADDLYYAKVTLKDIGGAGHDHICRADRSPDFTPEA